ncbi:MAG: T9SS C-terminal target domain-containing protein [Bacteroidetes bacterium]|nr:MAG: T9SS C-terminal target domain-containing protein [Bacteroidota bacterium]
MAVFIELDESGPTTSDLLSLPGYSTFGVTEVVPFAFDLDASENIFGVNGGSNLPAAMSQADRFALEDKIQHAIDYGALGFVTTVPMEAFVTPNSFIAPATTEADVQRGVDVAADAWTINIQSASYAPAVTVPFDLTFDNDGATTLADLTMDGTGKTLTLADDFTIGNSLTATNGLVLTGANKIVLEPVATISESNSSYVTGNVETTRDLNAASTTYDLGGLGLELTPQPFAGLPGVTTVTRVTGTALDANAPSTDQSITRYFDVVPATNVGLNVDILFRYFAHELNGNTDGSLQIFEAPLPYAADSWFHLGGDNSTLGEIAFDGMATFSRLSASADDVPLAPIDNIILKGDTVTGIPFTQVVVPVRVNDYHSITSFSGTLNWDPTLIDYAGIQDEAFGPGSIPVGTTNAATGTLTLSYAVASGQTLSDGDILFSLVFDVQPGLYVPQEADITWSSSPTALEVSQEKEALARIVDATFSQAKVEIPANVDISGTVRAETGDGINLTNLDLTGTNGPLQVVTDPTGTFTFTVSENQPNTIAASKPTVQASDIGNGISTFDIVLIQRHFNVLQPLSSPYKIIAADVNLSGGVNIFDIFPLQNLILGTTTSLAQYYRFVSSDHVFTNPNDPWDGPGFTNTRDYPLSTALTSQDFIGMKIGDVNNSWLAGNARITTVDEVYFDLADHQVEPGTQVTIPVHVRDFQNVIGYQFSLEWDPAVLQFESVQEGIVPAAYGTWNTSNGMLTTSWAGLQGQTFADGDTAFSLTFTVVGGMGAQSPLVLSSGFTPMEAYNGNLQYLSVVSAGGMVTVGADATTSILDPSLAGYALLKNVPNPFSTQTRIRFEIPQAGEVNLEIYNTTGQIVRRYQDAYGPGKHEVIWAGDNEAGMRLASGTYYCRMTSGQFTGVIKLVLTD